MISSIEQEENYAPTLWLDFIRFIAIAWVIVIHVSAGIVVHYTSHSFTWSIANIYSAITRSAVPLFFMVSGALILDQSKIMPLKLFYQKRIVKLVVPLVLWAMIYYCWQAFQTHHSVNILDMLKAILAEHVAVHLWFMYAILGLYLVAPILQVYVNAADSKNLLYFLGMWLLANSITTTFYLVSGVHFAIDFAVVYGWIGYFVAGRFFYQANYFISKRKLYNIILFSLIILCTAISAMGTVYFFVKFHKYNPYFYDGLASPIIIVMSFCWFILIKNSNPRLNYITQKYPFMRTILEKFRYITFGVYFIHLLIKDILAHFGFTATSFNPIFSIPLLSLVILCISAFIIILIRKIPLVRWLAP